MTRSCCTAILLLAALSISAVENQTSTAQAWVEELRAANQARAAVASEANAWRHDKERLQAVIAGVDAERERLAKEADEAERIAASASDELRAIGTDSELDALRVQLTNGALGAHAALTVLAQKLPPGSVTVGAATADGLFDEVARAIDAAEHAATAVSVDVVPGTLAGKTVAVKILRIAGACAWWVSLDGQQSGTVGMNAGGVVLTPAADDTQRLAIAKALAIVEGRLPTALVLLPLLPIAAGAAP